jgi:hypothetical protein
VTAPLKISHVPTAELFKILESVIAARCYLHFIDTELGSMKASPKLKFASLAGSAAEQSPTEGTQLSGPTPKEKLNGRKLQNKPIRKSPARMVVNLIIEDVMLHIEESVRLSNMRKAQATAKDVLDRDVARHRFRQDGRMTVTNAVSGNTYALVFDKPNVKGKHERTTQRLYEKVKLAVPEVSHSSSLCIWYETGSGKSLQKFPIEESAHKQVEHFAGRPLFALFKDLFTDWDGQPFEEVD